MTLPPTPTTEPDEVVGQPPSRRPTVTVTMDWSRAPAVGTALGVSLVGAAIVVSAMHARETGDLDLSNFIAGVLATIGLLGLATGAHVLMPGSERRAALVSWPGAAGVLGAGLMVGVLIDDDPVSAYVGALLVVALSVGGYLATRAWPFALGTILGLAVAYAQVFEDVIDFDGDGTNVFMIVGAAILVFVVAVTLGGWPLPATRVLSGVVVGAGGLAAMAVALQGLVFFGLTAAFSDGFGSSGDVTYEGDYSGDAFPEGAEFPEGEVTIGEDFPDFDTFMRDNPYQDDVYVILAYCAILVLLWAGCALATGHVGFRILIASTAVLVVPMATIALYVNHPTWWSVGLGAFGAIMLIGVALRPRRDRTEAPTP